MKNTTDGRGHEWGSAGLGWVDRPESAEEAVRLAERVTLQQKKLAARVATLNGNIGRGQHQKQLLGAFGTLSIYDSIPEEAKHAPFAEPALYRVACRISNGQPCPFRDQAPDVRGVAVKFFAATVETDLVMTNEGGRSHTRTATQFTEVADFLAAVQFPGGALDAIKTLARGLARRTLGPFEAARAFSILGKETVLRKVHSMATEHYWGSVVKLGGAAVKYSLHPHSSTSTGTQGNPRSADYLRQDLLERLSLGPLRYELGLQFFVDEETTPVNDASVAWKAPLVPVGELEIAAEPAAADEAVIDRMAFNPGNGFEPLGITHVRKVAYATSAKNRGAVGRAEVVRYFEPAAGIAASRSPRLRG